MEGKAGEARGHLGVKLLQRRFTALQAYPAASDGVGVHGEHEVRNRELVAVCIAPGTNPLVLQPRMVGEGSSQSRESSAQDLYSTSSSATIDLLIAATLALILGAHPQDFVVADNSGAYFVSHAEADVALVEQSVPLAQVDVLSTLAADLKRYVWILEPSPPRPAL